MNKLVSKNPVLRFKLGNRIIKAQNGLKTYKGLTVILSPSGSGMFMGYDPSTKKYNANILVTAAELDTKVGKGNSKGKIYKGYDGYWYQNGRKLQSSKLYGSNSEIKQKQTVRKPTVVTKPAVVTKPVVAKRAATGYTLPEGVTSVTDTQTMLKNAGFDLGKYGIDGVWGKDTLAAYDAWKNSLNSKINPTAASEVNKEFINIPLTASVTSPATIIPNKITVPQITYDRTGIRQLIRDRGFNPYLFSGALRKALRMVMNGQGTDTDRAIVSGMGIFKNGGLISRNPIKRFKLNK